MRDTGSLRDRRLIGQSLGAIAAARWWHDSALLDALRDGRISAAALDVVAEEPLPPETAALPPPWALPRVHGGWAS